MTILGGEPWVVDEAGEGFVVEDDGGAVGERAQVAFDAVAVGDGGIEGGDGVFDQALRRVVQAAMGDGPEEDGAVEGGAGHVGPDGWLGIFRRSLGTNNFEFVDPHASPPHLDAGHRSRDDGEGGVGP